MTWNSAPPGANSERTMPEGLCEARTHMSLSRPPANQCPSILTTRWRCATLIAVVVDHGQTLLKSSSPFMYVDGCLVAL